jgi:hypothetical protein
MTVRYILKCYNDSCENFGGFVNEPEFDFENELDEQSFSESFGHGGEVDEDYCPYCGQLATMEDSIEITGEVFESGT